MTIDDLKRKPASQVLAEDGDYVGLPQIKPAHVSRDISEYPTAVDDKLDSTAKIMHEDTDSMTKVLNLKDSFKPDHDVNVIRNCIK